MNDLGFGKQLALKATVMKEKGRLKRQGCPSFYTSAVTPTN
jgi:hypothetical protein